MKNSCGMSYIMLVGALLAMITSSALAQSDATILIEPSQTTHLVSPYLYGQFAEHVGRCIYDGIWVGEDSDIPNDDGIRLDTVEAA